jgi:hypothetical protein
VGVGAEDAAIAGFRAKHRAASEAIVEEQAAVRGDGFGGLVAHFGQVIVARIGLSVIGSLARWLSLRRRTDPACRAI